MSAQTDFAITVQKNVQATMRDGTVLRADIYRPRGAGPFPSLLMRTPYDKLRAQNAELAEKAAARGYVVAVQDIRGRYASDGDFDPFYSETYGNACIEDGHDSVEWAARLDGTTGKVGTFGVSYNSWTQWKLAPTRPPSLAAMFAGGMDPDSRLVWPGIFTRERQLQWNNVTLAPDTRGRHDLPGYSTVAEAQHAWDTLEKGKWLWFEPMSEFPPEQLGGLYKFWHSWLSRHHEDWFQFGDKYPEIDVPIYHVTSWYDRFLGTILQYNGMVSQGRTPQARASQKLIIGPWTHGFNFTQRVGVMDYGPDAGFECADLMARWFDHWLKGQDTGLLDEPPIRLFVMGENVWRHEHEWPLARTRWETYYLHSEGGANTPFGNGWLSQREPADEEPDRYGYDPRDPVMSLYLPNAQAGPADVRVLDHRRDMLVYQTPPLAHDVEVTGPIEVTLYAASSAPDTDWTARLVDVHPDGFAVNLGYGIKRARFRDGWDNPTLIEPGRVYEYRVPIHPTSNLFKAGHRIRLDISSSDFPNFDRNHNVGRNDWEDPELRAADQTVFHDARYPSRIVLPIIPRS